MSITSFNNQIVVNFIILSVLAGIVSKPTQLTKRFGLVGSWSIRFKLVGLLDWVRFSRSNKLSVGNNLKEK